MALKYPKGTSNIDSMITDVIASQAWIDLILELKLAHMVFPVTMSESVNKNSKLLKKFNNFCKNISGKMSYREKVDFICEVVSIEGISSRDVKTLLISMGEIRNKIAHNLVFSLIPGDFDIYKDTVGAKIIRENYKFYCKAFKSIKPIIESLEDSMA